MKSWKGLQIAEFCPDILDSDSVFYVTLPSNNSLRKTSFGLSNNLGKISRYMLLKFFKDTILIILIIFNGLQRIDLRDNGIQSTGLAALLESLETNTSVIRLDLDRVPRKYAFAVGFFFCYVLVSGGK